MKDDQPSSVSEQYHHLLEGFRALPEVQGRTAAYEFVRDLAYGNIGSRSAFDVLAARKGTCSGKHALLRMFLEGMKYEVQTWFALHDFGRFPIAPWPEALAAFRGEAIPDYHDFLKVRIDSVWIAVDAVFDAPLVSLGFPLLTWDGITSMELPVQSSRVFQSKDDTETQKLTLIAALTPEEQKLRRKFLSALTGWLDNQRKEE